MPPLFQSIENGHLEHESIAKHYIKVTTEITKQIHSATYMQRPWARKFEKAEIDKTLF